MGMVVGSVEKTERFLRDMRKTSQELVLEEYAGEIKRLAHQQGLLYSNEPYGIFRIEGLQPQLWDPLSGKTRADKPPCGRLLGQKFLTGLEIPFYRRTACLHE